MKEWKVKDVRALNFLQGELNILEADGWTIQQVIIDTLNNKLNYRIAIVAWRPKN